MTRPPRSARRGVTLIELLVVLVIMAVTAAVVLPTLTPPSRPSDQDPTVTVVVSARRIAIKRAEPLRLRIDKDGLWALVTLHDGLAVAAGRVAGAKPTADGVNDAGIALLLTIDPLGSCQPGDGRADRGAYDPLACRWSNAVARTASASTPPVR